MASRGTRAHDAVHAGPDRDARTLPRRHHRRVHAHVRGLHAAGGWALRLHLAGASVLRSRPPLGRFVRRDAHRVGDGEARAGTCRWVERVTHGDGRLLDVASGSVVVTADLAAARAGDLQSWEEKTLAIVEAALAGRLTSDIESYQILGRAVSKIPAKDLLRLRGELRATVSARGTAAARAASTASPSGGRPWPVRPCSTGSVARSRRPAPSCAPPPRRSGRPPTPASSAGEWPRTPGHSLGLQGRQRQSANGRLDAVHHGADDEVRSAARILRARARQLARQRPDRAVPRPADLERARRRRPPFLQADVRGPGGEPDEAVNKAIESAWDDWRERPVSADGKWDLATFEQLQLQTAFTDGECFTRMLLGLEFRHGLGYRRSTATWSTSCSRAPPAIAIPRSAWGSRSTASGARCATARDDPQYMPGQEARRHYAVDAADVLHGYRAGRANQTRGVTMFARVMYDLNMLAGYNEGRSPPAHRSEQDGLHRVEGHELTGRRRRGPLRDGCHVRCRRRLRRPRGLVTDRPGWPLLRGGSRIHPRAGGRADVLELGSEPPIEFPGRLREADNPDGGLGARRHLPQHRQRPRRRELLDCARGPDHPARAVAHPAGLVDPDVPPAHVRALAAGFDAVGQAGAAVGRLAALHPRPLDPARLRLGRSRVRGQRERHAALARSRRASASWPSAGSSSIP